MVMSGIDKHPHKQLIVNIPTLILVHGRDQVFNVGGLEAPAHTSYNVLELTSGDHSSTFYCLCVSSSVNVCGVGGSGTFVEGTERLDYFFY